MTTIDDSLPVESYETKVPVDIDVSLKASSVESDLSFDKGKDALSREQLLLEQSKDPDIVRLTKRALPMEETAKVGECFYLKDNILMRKWRPPDASADEVWCIIHQVVVPVVYHKDIMSLAHDTPMAGIPKAIQSDQGSNFMSGLFQQVMHELGIRQYKSSAYHPESQGALERFHQTLKTMIKTHCYQNEKDWDEGVHLVLFAAREAVQESPGFSPFELVFGHTVRGPLKLLKEKWLTETSDLNL
ncbi:uncharacterized protein LOC106180458 [Lingula anatina]|uniref:Uncharacterized protein LOC106180458 n=1 Tax=Lingula anatina TaxID=7574 RepID=A0A1S3KBT2_LINAN|nr:uncharacterized protein LOC106180458 [Lingula anatina]|eukprot:XP_013419899.1 uncharacterized protein LOC106180458 [Lingula anatina]